MIIYKRQIIFSYSTCALKTHGYVIFTGNEKSSDFLLKRNNIIYFAALIKDINNVINNVI